MIYCNLILKRKVYKNTIWYCWFFLISVNTKDIINDLKNLDDLFNSSNLNGNHELFRNKIKRVIGIFNIETPKFFWIDEYNCLRSKMHEFKCGYDNKSKLKGIPKSQAKHNKFEEFKKCFDGEKYQKECDNQILRSLNHEIYLQQIQKTTLSLFDDKMFKKIMKHKPCNWIHVLM